MRPFFILFLLFCTLLTNAQKASIREEKINFKTYPYSDPDPVARMTKFYPYFRFDGLTVSSIQKEWNFVVLENDYIKVYVAPEMGGKVWGAIEKSSGEDFIYFNNEVKFRDISMRGAWTSGGIELNFGSIGHAPSTASPVNYKLVENSDGSVSCFVGAPDLTSRTEWRVEIRLGADKAYFETNGYWYNPTGETTSLYNWMTASVDASEDLEFIFPGDTKISHGGIADSWPVDSKGRSVSWYRNNDFEGGKSYHVLGSFEEYFCTFFHNKNFGMGHWAPREERPGMKVFLWSMARNGGIWHDLLTDTSTNPQYTELQTGFLYNQAGARSTYSPYKHLFFDGNSENQFTEIWFPVKGTGGMVKADPYGTLNITRLEGTDIISFCALQSIEGRIVINAGGKELLNKEVSLKPMDLFEEKLDPKGNNTYSIDVAGVFHYASTEREDRIMTRPTMLDEAFDWNSVEGLYTEATELEKQRYYAEALKKYDEVLSQQAYHIKALVGKANILYRKMDYAGAEAAALNALSINTYDADANFIYGLICSQLGNKYDALESYGLAMRSIKYRSAANLQMARIYYRESEQGRAEKYARQSLDYNRNNIQAHMVLALIEKTRGNEEEKNTIISEILDIDPLNAFAGYESGSFPDILHFEMPHEVGLELAINYYHLGETEEAIRILGMFEDHPIVRYWLAWLAGSSAILEEAMALSPEFVYPFRNETAEVLKWAMKQNNSWKTLYYLALIHWHKGNHDEAKELFSACGNQPAFAPFYLSRGDFNQSSAPEKVEEDYLRALSLNKEQWRTYHKLVNLYNTENEYPKSLEIATQAHKKFPDHFVVHHDYARSLYFSDQYGRSVKELEGLVILPSEGARLGHVTYRNAHTLLALQYYQKGKYSKAIAQLDEARKWPENLGAGRPHEPDERIEDFLESFCYKKMGNKEEENAMKQKVVDYTLEIADRPRRRSNSSTLLGAMVLRETGQQERADQIMNGWLTNEEDKLAQWAMAVYSGDSAQAKKLIGNMGSKEEGTPWNPVRYDATFELVSEICTLQGGE